MKMLVTGAGGFLGRYIAEQLVRRGDYVRAFCRGSYPELDAIGVTTIQGDIRNREKVIAACEGIDCIFHVAALPGIWGPWSAFYGVNTVGTQHVLEGARRNRVSRFVFTSSPSVTFSGSPQEGVDESAPFPKDDQWLAHYPHSKALAEKEVLCANGDGGMATTALRPHLIWGPRDTQLIPRLIARARTGRLRRVGDGANRIDMIHVENAATAHLAAADALTAPDAAPAGNAYFLSQGEPVNCWDWISEILALAEAPSIEKTISLKSAWRLGAACERIWRFCRLPGEPPMTRFLAAQLGVSHWYAIDAARRDFGYKPVISTRDGMLQLGEWIRKREVRATGFAT